MLLAPFVGILVAGDARQGLATAPSVENWVIGLLGRLLELLPADRRALLPNNMDAFKGTGDIQLNRLMADASHTTLRAWLMVYRALPSTTAWPPCAR